MHCFISKIKFNFSCLIGSRLNPANVIFWTVEYPNQYLDETEDEEEGNLDEEVTLEQLNEGIRLKEEFDRLKTSFHVNIPVCSFRAYCFCLKKNGVERCLAKQQQASPFASKHPNKMYWACNKPTEKVIYTITF